MNLSDNDFVAVISTSLYHINMNQVAWLRVQNKEMDHTCMYGSNFQR